MLSTKQVRHTLLSLTLPLATLASFTNFSVAKAQITPDNSLGAESSVVTPNVQIKDIPSDRIDGGATRGGNLFHSFQEFNINAGRGVYFSNPGGIANILTRVTGGNFSNIQGVLGVLGSANLFLINPNGILFGPNARLDVGGSFLGSTANSLIFNNNFEFSATNPQAPPLLTINIPIGLGFRNNPGNITNQSNQPTIVDNSGNPIGLTVPSGNSLALVGGDINSDDGRITVPGGRVELGGLAGVGTVGLDVSGNTFKLNFPGDSLLSNITLANDARVAVRGNGGGDIVVNANNFTATNGGRLTAGTEGVGNAGDITVNVNNFNISGVGLSQTESGVYNQTLAGASGNNGNIFINSKSFSASSGAVVRTSTLAGSIGDGGNINITTGSLSLTDAALINASTYGLGNAGDVSVQASGAVELVNSDILSSVEAGGVGKGGNIDIKAASLSLLDGAQLQTAVRGASSTQPGARGDAGNVTVYVTGPVTIAGVKDGFRSGIFSTTRTGAVGNGGNIRITSGSFSLRDGSSLNTSTFGQGNAGNVTVDVTGPVTIAGVKDGFTSAIFSFVGTGAKGNGGNITISSGSFSLSDGAQLSASTFGKGDAGSVSVRASGGVSLVNSLILSSVGAGGEGNGGNIDIKAATLSLKDSAQLLTLVRQASSTQLGATGNAGNVTVDVTGPVTIAGQKDGFRSGIISSVETGVQGNGGSITITSGSFSLTDGGRLNTSTFGQGNSGNVSVRSSGAVELAGSNTTILSAVEASGVGNGGNIDIKAASFSLKDGAQLLTLIREASSTQPGAIGNGGNVTIDVTGSVTIAGVDKYGLFPSAIISDVGTGVRGNGGYITITSGSFSLSDGAQLNASTRGRGNGGRVSVLASDLVELTGSNTGIFTTVGSTGVGNGGNLRIVAGRFNVLDRAEVTVSNLGIGNAGNLEVIANSINLNNKGKLTANSENGIGGNIILQARDLLLLRRNSEISATTGGAGQDGNIKIDTEFLVAFPGENSDIVATGFGRTGGSNVQLNASGGIFGIEYRPERTSDNDIVASGTVTLSTPDTDPKRGLFEFLETVPDPAQQIAQHPCIKGFGSSFTITGRGGLPTDPNKILSGDNVRIDLVKPVASTVSSTSATQKQASQEPTVKKIIPAQGWIFNEKGEVLLVGYDPTKTGPLRQQPAPASSCAAVK